VLMCSNTPAPMSYFPSQLFPNMLSCDMMKRIFNELSRNVLCGTLHWLDVILDKWPFTTYKSNLESYWVKEPFVHLTLCVRRRMSPVITSAYALAQSALIWWQVKLLGNFCWSWNSCCDHRIFMELVPLREWYRFIETRIFLCKY
jgi:hypothetical protein